MLRAFLIFIFTFFLTNSTDAQLTVESLDKAVQQHTCSEILPELEGTDLKNEQMKFQAGVCYFRSGYIEKAQPLFAEVVSLKQKREHIARFWLAKCSAKKGQDSMAIGYLLNLPSTFLNAGYLSVPAFSGLSNNPAFKKLTKKYGPHFNAWTSVLAGIAALGFILGFMLLFGRSRFTIGEKELSLAVFAFAFILTAYVLIWTKYSVYLPYLANSWSFFTFLVGPALYFYLKKTFKEATSNKELVLHFSIPVFMGVLILPTILTKFSLKSGILFDFYKLGSSSTLMTCHILFYTILVFKNTRNQWQIDENIKIWTRIIAWGMVIYSAAFISYFALVACSFFNPEWDYSISLVMALAILAITYMGFLQKRIFQSEPIQQFLPIKKYKSSNLTEQATSSIKNSLEKLLVEEEVYKENELRLGDLAAYMGITYHQLSQVINEHYGLNFFEFINGYRVKHVQKLLADSTKSHLTIIQIAYEAGFNNKASFNRYFKKEVGLTPSAYRLKKQSLFKIKDLEK